MRNTLTTATFGIALKQFTHLEEQHDEHGLRELRLGSWQEPDAQRPDGGDGHQEVFVQCLAVQQSFGCFLQRVVTY